MKNIAQVIVDVPVMQTNQSYDYLIPDELMGVIEKGMRVVVPFGQGNRAVQAFVVGFKSSTAYEDQLKPITASMDLQPVLNDELIDLGKEMSNQTYSFAISCYQTMLPSVLRASYEKFIRPTDQISPQAEAEYFADRYQISWQEAEERQILDSLSQLAKKDQVSIYYEVNDKRTIKKEKYVQAILSPAELDQAQADLNKNASKQYQLLELLKALEGKEQAFKKMKEAGFTYRDVNIGEEKGWLKQFDKEVWRNPYDLDQLERTQPLSLNSDQQAAYNQLLKSLDQDETFLLQGITGSGKTEVYMQLIAQVLMRGQSAIVLVPEISLTPQMVKRFKGRFGNRVAVMHSGLSEGERYDEWRRVMSQQADVVVGARSSIFAPLENLGLIIIDEEHEDSYKQNENPRYHARRVAKWRSAYHQCPLILGSATPSLESRARALKDRYHLLEMKERPTGQPLPEVQVVDMTHEAQQGNFSLFSQVLMDKVEDRLNKQEQIVLMLNRRGYSSFVLCRDCGYVLQCPNCDISQTLHMDSHSMKCHYCGHEEEIPQLCSHCHSRSIRYFGTGTQKIEEELQKRLPQARILRMDRDTTRRKGAHEKILTQFANKQADILLGTQMIAKGLDFPNITLVGVLNADTALNLPDFRSSEKTFQLLTQVSGRAGRGDQAGEVIVQSYNPQHYAIQLAKAQDYDKFFHYEMNYRHRGNYPPYYYVVRLSVSHEEERHAWLKIYELRQQIEKILSPQAILLGPSPHAIARTQNKYHFQLLIKYKNEKYLHQELHRLLNDNQDAITKGLRIVIDPQPTTFM